MNRYQNPLKDTSRKALRGKLLVSTGMTLTDFADHYDYPLGTVLYAVNQHVGRSTSPRGQIVTAILDKLAECAESSAQAA